MTYTYDLTLGLPHTNHRFFAEQLMLKFAGHFQWQSIAAAAGLPLSSLRTADGGEVYASFYYIEIIIPEAAPLESFRLDDIVRFAISLRAFKNMAFEGLVHFDRPERLSDASPYIRFANIFIRGITRGQTFVLRIRPFISTMCSRSSHSEEFFELVFCAM